MTTYQSRGSAIGDYRIEHELLRTRNVVVYRAIHATLGRPVAIKILEDKATQLRGAAEQFVREAQVLDRLRHTGVARVFDCGELPGGRPWFACEHLVGPTLAEVIASGSRIDHAYVLGQLAAIVGHAHRAGIAHRNLRAEAVVCIVEPTGVRLVIDDWTATRELAQMPSDAGADVYALGVIALQLLGGVMAFSAGAAAMLAGGSVAARFPRAPRTLTSLVDRMLARDLRLRPSASAVAFAANAIVATAGQPSGHQVIGLRNSPRGELLRGPAEPDLASGLRDSPSGLPASYVIEADFETTRISRVDQLPYGG